MYSTICYCYFLTGGDLVCEREGKGAAQKSAALFAFDVTETALLQANRRTGCKDRRIATSSCNFVLFHFHWPQIAPHRDPSSHGRQTLMKDLPESYRHLDAARGRDRAVVSLPCHAHASWQA